MLGTVVATATARAVAQVDAGEAAPSHPRWWLTVVDEVTGEPVGAVMRTAPFAPYPLYVLPLPEGAAPQVAAALVERGEEVSGLNGALPAVRHLATELARRTGRRAHVHEHTRLHVLEKLVEPPAAPDGRPRLALPADAELALAWFRAFHADAAAQAGRLQPGAGASSSTRPTSPSGSPRAGSGFGRTARDAGQPGRLQRAELRGRPGGPGLHARATAGAATRARSPPTCRGCCATRGRGSACSPTRPTRRPTRSTRRSATCRSWTWRTW